MIKEISIKNFKKEINGGFLKASDLVNYLLTLEGVKSNHTESTSLKDLSINGNYVLSAKIDTENYILMLEIEDKKTIAIGTVFYDINGKKTITGTVETNKGIFYTIKESNSIFTYDQIVNYKNKESETIAKIEKNKIYMEKIEKQIKEEQDQKKIELEEYNNIYGYANNETPMQKGKILKCLNTTQLFNKKLSTRKGNIHRMIKEGSKKSKIVIINNKKVYRVYYNDNESFLELTKTEYDYFNYLIENNIKVI